MPFKKGVSGRPKGSMNKRNLMEEAISNYSSKFDVKAKDLLIEQYISFALSGDTTANKFILERSIPK